MGSVEPGAVPPVLPRTAPAEEPWTTRMVFPATTSQLVVFPEQVFLMMMFPAVSTSMPRSAPMQLLPSTRLSAPVMWMFAPSAVFPLLEQVLPRTMQLPLHKIPSEALLRKLQSTIAQPLEAVTPSFPFQPTELAISVPPVPSKIPLLMLLYTEQCERTQLESHPIP